MQCPYCGKEMIRGHISIYIEDGGRVIFYKEHTVMSVFDELNGLVSSRSVLHFSASKQGDNVVIAHGFSDAFNSGLFHSIKSFLVF